MIIDQSACVCSALQSTVALRATHKWMKAAEKEGGEEEVWYAGMEGAAA